MDCPICLEGFNTSLKQPLVLECGHSICKGCLSNIYNSHTYICPYDRIPISKPFNQIRPNYALQEVIKYFSEFNIQEKLPKFYASKIPKKQQIQNHEEYCSTHTFIYNIESNKKRSPICIFCHRLLSDSFWSCAQCILDLCDYCYQDQEASTTKLSNPELKCEKSHSLYYYENTSKFYKRLGIAEGKITCKICKVNWFGSSWGCRICDFELCQLCKAKLSMPHKCDNQHSLILMNNVMEGYSKLGITHWKCNVCKQHYECESYHCSICRYNMCRNCYMYFTSNIPLDAKCPNNHHIYHSDDQVKLYVERDGREVFKCSVCCREKANESFHCRRCEFDMCVECYEKIESVKGGVGLRCFKEHELKWGYDFEEFECKNCERVQQVCGNVRCGICDFKVCLECAIENLPDSFF